MVSDAEFEKVQRILNPGKYSARPQENIHEFILSGLVTCAGCGHAIVTKKYLKKLSDGSGKEYHYCHCCNKGKNGKCKYRSVYVREEELIEQITETKKNLDNLRHSVYMRLIPDKAFFLAEQESLEKEIAHLEDERSKVMAIANDWKDIANDAFMFARYAKEDFDSDDWERKRAVIKRLGASLKLSGRTIEFTPVKYLVPVTETKEFLKAKKEAARTAPEQIKKGLKEGQNEVWWNWLDFIQTHFGE